MPSLSAKCSTVQKIYDNLSSDLRIAPSENCTLTVTLTLMVGMQSQWFAWYASLWWITLIDYQSHLARVVGTLQMILQLVSSIFPCSSLLSGTWRTPGLFIPWCCLHTSSSVCFVFFPLLLCLARWFWPDLMNGKLDHTTAVYISLQWSGGLCVVWLPAGSWHRHPRW